jgi:hypothetical protein
MEHREDGAHRVLVLRHISGKLRQYAKKKRLYSDKYVRLDALVNTNGRPVAYIFRHYQPRRKIPKFVGDWAVVISFRRPHMQYQTREYTVIFADAYTRLIRFGKEHSDYVFVSLAPPKDNRMGDKRFSTIADVHPVEKDLDAHELIKEG